MESASLQQVANRKKERFTTYICGAQLQILREISEQTGRPISALIGEALDDFLQAVGWLREPMIPPVEKQFYRSAAQKKKVD